MKFYTLPSIPSDFCLSSNSYSLAYLFRILVESNSSSVIPIIQEGILNDFDKIQSMLNHTGDSFVVKYIDIKGLLKNIYAFRLIFYE